MERHPCSYTGKLNIIKMSILTIVIYRFSKISFKIPTNFFMQIKKPILKFTGSARDPDSQNNLEK